MKEKLERLRSLVDEIEQESGSSESRAERALVTGLELPDIIRDVVDFLFPELKPYEAAVYMYMLRHSVVETGSQLTRVSRRGLQSGVIKSPVSGTLSGGGEVGVSKASYQTIRIALEGLETLGAIRRESEPNREGSLYRVMLPEELEVCRKAKAAAAATINSKPIDEAKDVDYYNIRENRLKVYERDNYHCRYCEKQLTRFTTTLDHVHPVAEGGDNSIDNLVTACLDCNSRKNSRPLDDFLASRS